MDDSSSEKGSADAQHRPPFDPQLDVPKYLLGEAAAAAGVSVGTLKAWVSRQPTVIGLGPHDRPGHGKGSARLFTLRRIQSIAITAELVRLGLAPSRAGFFAYVATDVRTEREAADAQREAADARVDGEPPDEVEVKDLYLVAYPDETIFDFAVPPISVTELLERHPPPYKDARLGPQPARPAISFVLVNIAALSRRVRLRLSEMGKAQMGMAGEV